MLTTDPGDSDECYACKLLEVLIVYCHHSLMQVGGAGSLVGGVEIQMGGVMSQCFAVVQLQSTHRQRSLPHVHLCVHY